MFDVFQSKRRGGMGRNQDLSSHLFLPPISKYRGFWASFSMGTGIKKDLSKYFPVVTWVFTGSWFLERAHRQFHLSEKPQP